MVLNKFFILRLFVCFGLLLSGFSLGSAMDKEKPSPTARARPDWQYQGGDECKSSDGMSSSAGSRGSQSSVSPLSSPPSDEDSSTIEARFQEIKPILLRSSFEETLSKIKSAAANFPTCFISYAWGNKAHEALVHGLAGDLQKAGLNIKLDIWHNPAGTRISRFTETIGRSDYVVLVGSQKLMEKYANEASGAVVNEEVSQIFEKHRKSPGTIIPILLDGKKETSLPPFLGDVVYIDFSRSGKYYESTLGLIECLFPNDKVQVGALVKGLLGRIGLIDSALPLTKKKEYIQAYERHEKERASLSAQDSIIELNKFFEGAREVQGAQKKS